LAKNIDASLCRFYLAAEIERLKFYEMNFSATTVAFLFMVGRILYLLLQQCQ
jgi:hypothetical protein